MKFWRINTDAEPDDRVRTCDLWYEHGMAFAGDHEPNKWAHATVFDKLAVDDGVFMYHNGLGIVGYGRVKESWDHIAYEGDSRLLYRHDRKECWEYRLRVEWEAACDCRTNPLPQDHRLPPPKGAYCEVNPEKWDIAAVLRDLRKRALK